MKETQTVGIALVGCGTVGSHVARLLLADAEMLAMGVVRTAAA